MINCLSIIFVSGISLAPFLFPKLHPWIANGLYSYILMILILSASFFNAPKRHIKNLPFALVIIAACFMTLVNTHQTLLDKNIKFELVIPAMNFLFLALTSKVMLEYLDFDFSYKIIDAMRIVLTISVFICFLQVMDASQFFKLINPTDKYDNNIVGGFVLNGTHQSAFMGFLAPLFLYRKKREDYLMLAFMAIIMIFTGHSINNPSISGPACLLFVLFCYITKKPVITFIVFLILYVIAVSVAWHFFQLHPHDPKLLKWYYKIASLNGRETIWTYYWNIFKDNYPISGLGLGAVNILHKSSPIPSAHIHLEPLHFLVELGVIGMVLIVNWVKDFCGIHCPDRITFALKVLILAYLLSGLFNWPMHLWVPSVFAIVSYSIFILRISEYGNVQKRA